MDFKGLPLGAIALDDSSDESFRSTSSGPSTPRPVARRGKSRWYSNWSLAEDITAPYLCQACLSVLTMDGLEIGKPYSHHDSLKSLLAAYQMGCNICYLAFHEDMGPPAEVFMVLAEGSVEEFIVLAKHMVKPTDEDQLTGDAAFSSREMIENLIRAYWRRAKDGEPFSYFEDEETSNFSEDKARSSGSEAEETVRYTEEEETLISFTGLWISSDSTHRLTVCMRLNPSYKDFIPIGMQAYWGFLWESWRSLAYRMFRSCERELITAHGTSRPTPDDPAV